MSKSRKSGSRKAKQKANAAGKAQVADPERRNVLQMLGKGAVGLGVLGGAGYAGLGSFRAHAAEHDLSRIGQGDPVIVQVHDPQCPICTALQKQTRKALKALGDECNLTYLIADIKTDAGSTFALAHGVPHVTLVLLDGQGQRQQIVSGMQSRDQLVPVFQAHKDAFGT